MTLNRVVAIEIPEGGIAKGTKVRLEDGSTLQGVSSIELKSSVDSPFWQLSITLHPKFKDQLPIQAVLKDIGVSPIDTVIDTRCIGEEED
ncbi:hypothetical protein [Acinetobacter baumannii]|uniref:hypothetical protein n=1 Tax=Acinetobacter baumannii TaxID=470 RepID=UPI0025431D87|nr:hypothetical protein [Acinetobacter baumannii]WIH75509.1 hypothetical protein M2A29_05660 [Acinetobacter baumannii]